MTLAGPRDAPFDRDADAGWWTVTWRTGATTYLRDREAAVLLSVHVGLPPAWAAALP